jgi:hypothetical protein
MADPRKPTDPDREGDPLHDHASPFDRTRGLECLEWCPICRTADVLRATAPPELRDQWQAVQREALLTVRSLIDSYLERIDADDGAAGPRVQEIPIE